MRHRYAVPRRSAITVRGRGNFRRRTEKRARSFPDNATDASPICFGCDRHMLWASLVPRIALRTALSCSQCRRRAAPRGTMGSPTGAGGAGGAAGSSGGSNPTGGTTAGGGGKGGSNATGGSAGGTAGSTASGGATGGGSAASGGAGGRRRNAWLGRRGRSWRRGWERRRDRNRRHRRYGRQRDRIGWSGRPGRDDRIRWRGWNRGHGRSQRGKRRWWCGLDGVSRVERNPGGHATDGLELVERLRLQHQRGEDQGGGRRPGHERNEGRRLSIRLRR